MKNKLKCFLRWLVKAFVPLNIFIWRKWILNVDMHNVNGINKITSTFGVLGYSNSNLIFHEFIKIHFLQNRICFLIITTRISIGNIILLFILIKTSPDAEPFHTSFNKAISWQDCWKVFTFLGNLLEMPTILNASNCNT